MAPSNDRIDSDDLDEIIAGWSSYQATEDTNITSGGISEHADASPAYQEELETELAYMDAEIAKNEALVARQKAERQKISNDLKESQIVLRNINYSSQEFNWKDKLKTTMKAVFGIESFHLCQEGVCNANMDRRDIVCIMPTGGGKSLTYQLPALLQPGCTLVISPLISLINDQLLNLKDAKVEAAKLTGDTPEEESLRVIQVLRDMATKNVDGDGQIKLCYVTPEKIAKNFAFVKDLQNLAAASQLARIVIDEAHCISQLGHDFRPDYEQLNRLRELFPHVPIMALSATCPPKVLEHICKTLRLKDVVDGNDAFPERTVLFTAPLYRKNLHYKIVQKPDTRDEVIKTMANYITTHHPDDCGIVYCRTQKDTETVAKGLEEYSKNKIKAGIYHADRSESQKEEVHNAWRDGEMKVVCATVAFGLGIDKPDVRFVLHHSIPKSIEAFYQESGRAGRDGKDSDCILFYRPQDGANMSAMVHKEKEGTSKFYAMLELSQDLLECRKDQFVKYFAHSAWSESDADKCGHCDNCTREPGSIDHRDISLEAWQITNIVQALDSKQNQSRTLKGLVDLIISIRKGKMKENLEIDPEAIAGGPVNLTKAETERLVVHLILRGYLAEKYIETKHRYQTAYIIGGYLAKDLCLHTRESIVAGKRVKIECYFRAEPSKHTLGAPKASFDSRSRVQIVPSKQKGNMAQFEDFELGVMDSDAVDSDQDPANNDHASKRPLTALYLAELTEEETDSDVVDLLDEVRTLKRARTSGKARSLEERSNIQRKTSAKIGINGSGEDTDNHPKQSRKLAAPKPSLMRSFPLLATRAYAYKEAKLVPQPRRLRTLTSGSKLPPFQVKTIKEDNGELIVIDSD